MARNGAQLVLGALEIGMVPVIDSTRFRSPKTNYTDGRTRPISIIVIHATASETLESAAGWLCNPVSEVSTHYIISQMGVIYQLVDDQNVAWHAGVAKWGSVTDVNGASLGIELENRNDGKDPYTPAQLDALDYLVLWKARQYKISVENIVRHLDVALPKGRKNDPMGFPWVDWKKEIEIGLSVTHDVWEQWGTQYPLYMDEKSFGIPQYWLKHAAVFGEARSIEHWITDEMGNGVWSYRIFQHGIVFYDKKTGTVHGVLNTGLTIAVAK